MPAAPPSRPASPVLEALRRLLGDSLVYGLGRVAGSLVGLVLMPLYAHHLSVEHYGLQDILFVGSALLGTFLPLGLTDAVQRFWFLSDTARDRARIIGSALAAILVHLAIWLPPLLLLAPWIVHRVFGVATGVLAFRLVGITLLPTCLLGLSNVLLKVRFRRWRFGVCAVTQVLVLGTVNVILVAGLEMGIDGIYLGGLISAVVTSGLALYFVRKDLSLRLSPGWLRAMLAYGVPLVPAFVALWALSYVDRWLLLAISGLREAGLYAAGAKIAGVLLLVNFASLTAFGPASMEIAERPEAKRFYARALTGYLFLAASIAVGLTALGRECLAVLTPPQYHAGHRAIAWLALGFVLQGVGNFVSVGFHVVRKTWHFTWIVLAAAATNVGLNLLLIPGYGLVGAAVATACSYGVMTLLFYVVGQRLFRVDWELSRLARVLLVLAAALAALRLLDGPDAWRILARIGVAVVFPLVLLLVRTITPDEVRAFVARVPGRHGRSD